MQLLGDRQTAITPASGNAATFAFDALGRYASRTIGGVTETYSYIGSSNVVWQDAASTTIQSAIDAAGDRNANQNGSTTSYLLSDLHGNAIGLEDGSTSISDAYRYDAWGTTIDSDSSGTPAPMPWKYQGRLDVSPSADPLYDFGARLYAPASGTFTQLDSVMGSAQDPLSMNRYLYAAANPATLIDLTGHTYCGPDGTLCGYGDTYKDPPEQGSSAIGVSTGTITFHDTSTTSSVDHGGATSSAGGSTPPVTTAQQMSGPDLQATPTPSTAATTGMNSWEQQNSDGTYTDATGLTYDPYRQLPDGYDVPIECIGASDVVACAAHRWDLDADSGIAALRALDFADLLSYVSAVTASASIALTIVDVPTAPIPVVGEATLGTTFVLGSISVTTGVLASVGHCIEGRASCAFEAFGAAIGAAGPLARVAEVGRLIEPELGAAIDGAAQWLSGPFTVLGGVATFIEAQTHG